MKKKKTKKISRSAKKISKTRKSVKRNTRLNVPKLLSEKEFFVTIMNMEGNLLSGVMHEAKKKSNTLAIVLHGFISSKNQVLIRQTCIELSRAGYDALRIDFSGNGDSEGRFEDATPRKMLRDIATLVEHYRKRYAKIILIGHSLGGLLALISASRIKIDGVVVIAMPTHPERFTELLTPQQNKELLSVGFTIMTIQKHFGEMPYTITQAFVEGMKQLAPLDAAKDVHCPVLVIRGGADKLATDDDSELLQRLYRKEYTVIGGADHNFTNPVHLDMMIEKILEWM